MLAGTTTTVISEVQQVGVDLSYQSTDLNTAAVSSRFPIDRAFHGGKGGMSFKVSDTDQWMVQRLLGGTVQAGAIAGFTTYKVDPTSKPTEFKVMFEGQDTNGKRILIIFPNVTGDGLKTDFSQGQYSMPDVALQLIDRGVPFRIAFEN